MIAFSGIWYPKYKGGRRKYNCVLPLNRPTKHLHLSSRPGRSELDVESVDCVALPIQTCPPRDVIPPRYYKAVNRQRQTGPRRSTSKFVNLMMGSSSQSLWVGKDTTGSLLT